jgi:hypothetical protein
MLLVSPRTPKGYINVLALDFTVLMVTTVFGLRPLWARTMTTVPLVENEKIVMELYWLAHVWAIPFDLFSGKQYPIFAPVLLIAGAIATIESGLYPTSGPVFAAVLIGHSLRALSRWTALLMPSVPRLERFLFNNLPRFISFVELSAVLWLVYSPCFSKTFFDVFQYTVTALAYPLYKPWNTEDLEEIQLFSKQATFVDQSRDKIQLGDIKTKSFNQIANEIRVYREANSHTPLLMDVIPPTPAPPAESYRPRTRTQRWNSSSEDEDEYEETQSVPKQEEADAAAGPAPAPTPVAAPAAPPTQAINHWGEQLEPTSVLFTVPNERSTSPNDTALQAKKARNNHRRRRNNNTVKPS